MLSPPSACKGQPLEPDKEGLSAKRHLFAGARGSRGGLFWSFGPYLLPPSPPFGLFPCSLVVPFSFVVPLVVIDFVGSGRRHRRRRRRCRHRRRRRHSSPQIDVVVIIKVIIMIVVMIVMVIVVLASIIDIITIMSSSIRNSATTLFASVAIMLLLTVHRPPH